MPQFMLLLYDEPRSWQNASPEDMQKAIEKYRAWTQKPFTKDSKRLADDLGRGDIAFSLNLCFGDLVARDIGRACCRDLQAEVFAEIAEVFVASHEIGFAVHFDHHANFAAEMDVALDETFLRRPVGFLGRGSRALLAKDRDGFFGITFGFGQSLLAVKQASASFLAQLFDHLGCDGSAHVKKISYDGRV